MNGISTARKRLVSAEHSYDLELRSSYREIADRAPRPVMADGLAAAFRSSNQGFAHLLAHLFARCDDEQRRTLFDVLASSLTLSSRQELIRARGSTGQRAVIEGVQSMAAEAARSDPSIVDRVGAFFSELPDVTKHLPVPTIAAVLAHVVPRLERGVARSR